eukprot:GHVP01006781.1.p1 GENE.GHVP01006781.1~~GHVP01006781.1.p1  ORF type:complete len:233 (-),score=29.40 GHVP01006781.1:1863-2561(-)
MKYIKALFSQIRVWKSSQIGSIRSCPEVPLYLLEMLGLELFLIRKNAPSLFVFDECQAGFADHRTALEQALKLRLRSELSKKNGKPYFSLLLDLKKAFDSVPQSLILASLKEKTENLTLAEKPAALQISSFITKWIQEKTNGHVYNDDGTETGSFTFKRGVPQGGILSPWLFNLCMDHLLKAADDICLAGENHHDIQLAAHFTDKWLIDNGMQLSYSKCESINLGAWCSPLP